MSKKIKGLDYSLLKNHVVPMYTLEIILVERNFKNLEEVSHSFKADLLEEQLKSLAYVQKYFELLKMICLEQVWVET